MKEMEGRKGTVNRRIVRHTHKEGTVAQQVCQAMLIVGLVATASPHEHRHIGQIGVVLQGHHSVPIHLGNLTLWNKFFF